MQNEISCSSTDARGQIDEVVHRVTILERQNRSLRRGVRALAMLLCAGILMGAGPKLTVPDMLAAKSFGLVDHNGNVRVLWRMTAERPEFAYFDAAGEPEIRHAPAPPPAAGAGDDGRQPSDDALIRFGKPEESEDDDSFDWVD
jgi:hypothetical protein